MLRKPICLAAAAIALVSGPAAAADGVKLRHSSYLAKLVPASLVENQSLQQYNELTRQAFQKRVLLDERDPQVQRLRRIQERLLPFSYKFNERAHDWKWEVNVIDQKTINAFCMPGGKIAFFTGILNQLKLSDDEVAMVMGHEIAHALREHAREKMAKSKGTLVKAESYLQHLDPSHLRYYYASKLGPHSDDIDLNVEEFVNKVNADLVGKVVNLASRTARFVESMGLSPSYPHDGGLFKSAAVAGQQIAIAYAETAQAVGLVGEEAVPAAACSSSSSPPNRFF